MRNVSTDKENAITAAADALVSEGNESPTNDAVRAKLGGGSIADISPVMRKWREAQKHHVGIRLNMPQAITQVGERFVAQLWAAADAEAAKALDTLQAESNARIDAVEAERDEALGEITVLEAAARQHQEALKALQDAKTESDTKLASLTQEHHSLALEREKAITQAQSSRENQTLLLAQLKEAQASNTALQGELVKLARSASKGKDKK